MKWNFLFFKKKNKDSTLKAFLRNAFGISTHSEHLYQQALRHSSASEKIGKGVKNSNERLEFLGDAVIDAVVAHYLYTKYPILPEGELTKMKSKVVRRENLNMLGYALQVDHYLVLNLGRQEMHDSIVGNAFEALVGAIYLDKGFQTTRDIVLRLMKQHGLDSKVHDDVDAKSKLHEWGQKYKRTVDFRVLTHRNEGGASHYRVSVFIDEKDYGTGEGSSKKSAEQRAAQLACLQLFPNEMNG